MQTAMAMVVEILAEVEAADSGYGLIGVVAVEDIGEETDQSRTQSRR